MTRCSHIAITGATGTMGRAALRFLEAHTKELSIRLLIQPQTLSPKEEKSLRDKGFHLVHGDLTDCSSIEPFLQGCELLIHLGALIPPAADYAPELAEAINLGGTQNLLSAINKLGMSQTIRMVYIGTVAETGDRLPPYHWGRVGDPIKPSVYDYYGVTKMKAERLVIESGLRYWVSLRQTAILHLGLFEVRDGIMFHQPLENCFEWIHVEDAGRLVLGLCTQDLPDSFYREIYNVGGGEGWRINYYDMLQLMYQQVGVKDFRDICQYQWFARRNFHGQWFLDSDRLAKIIPFRSENLQKTVEGFADDLPHFQKIAGYLPSLLLKAGPMKSLAQTPNGPLYWHKHHMRERLYAFFGEEDPFSQSRDWDSYKNTPTSQTPIVLNHGYDESKAEIDLTLSDLVEAAKFRGGTCLATDFGDRDMYRQVSWECAFGHRFSASPKLVLKAGHFCPQCDPLPWNYDRISQKNPFLAQVHKGEKVPHPAYEKEDVHDVFKKAGS